MAFFKGESKPENIGDVENKSEKLDPSKIDKSIADRLEDIFGDKQLDEKRNEDKVDKDNVDVLDFLAKLDDYDSGEEGQENDEIQNPRQEVIDGEIHYYDDNGILYRVGNELKPNNEYEINGYKYKTDDLGRIISAEGKLHLKEREGRQTIKDSIEDIGKGDEKEGDDRGHLIGDQFDGSNGLENMIPQDADINRKDFRKFENELASEVKKGKNVEVQIEPIYEGDSMRPSALVVTYTIDGETNIRIFPNDKED